VSHAIIDMLVDNREVWVLSTDAHLRERCLESECGWPDDTTLCACRHVGVINDFDTTM